MRREVPLSGRRGLGRGAGCPSTRRCQCGAQPADALRARTHPPASSARELNHVLAMHSQVFPHASLQFF